MTKYACKLCMKRFADERALCMHRKSPKHLQAEEEAKAKRNVQRVKDDTKFALGIFMRPLLPEQQAILTAAHEAGLAEQEASRGQK